MSFFSNRWAAAVVLLAAVGSAPIAAESAPTVIKMATLAPEGSSWFRVLQEMGEEWRKASDGAITLRIYPGGVAGDEDAVIRKMRVGQIQAAAITGIGLAYLEPSFYALHIPMMYASDEEFDYVRDRYAPVLERKMEEKGFVVLNWGDAGWVHFFSKVPVVTPAQRQAGIRRPALSDPDPARRDWEQKAPRDAGEVTAKRPFYPLFLLTCPAEGTASAYVDY